MRRLNHDLFWNEFFNVFEISRKRIATFEKHVKEAGNTDDFIDLFWKGHLIAEQKSGGKDLDNAYTQAKDYCTGLKETKCKFISFWNFKFRNPYDLNEICLWKTQRRLHIFSYNKSTITFHGLKIHLKKKLEKLKVDQRCY